MADVILPILLFTAAMVAVIVKTAKASGKGGGKTGRPTPKPPARPCPNPEAHRHYEAPAAKKQYDSFAQPSSPARSDTERRLENVKRLYDAGLLTREEYDHEVRRYRQGG